jgi:hypothetical protein
MIYRYSIISGIGIVMLRATRLSIVVLTFANWVAIAFFTLTVLCVLLDVPLAADRVKRVALPGNADTLKQIVVTILLIGITTSVAVDRIFRQILCILDSVVAGQPFASANGSRLRAMAWYLLVIQILDTGFAFAIRTINHLVNHAPFGWGPSATGWIAILLLFVLAHVFTQGAAMQDELEGTV